MNINCKHSKICPCKYNGTCDGTIRIDVINTPDIYREIPDYESCISKIIGQTCCCIDGNKEMKAETIVNNSKKD